MDYQQGQSLNKLALYTTCMDDMVPVDNTVHLIDQFVDSLDMRSLGFKMMSTQGKPPYHPADLLKLYIYGYMNRIRSSRQLEKECHCNLEVIWLFKFWSLRIETLPIFLKWKYAPCLLQISLIHQISLSKCKINKSQNEKIVN